MHLVLKTYSFLHQFSSGQSKTAVYLSAKPVHIYKEVQAKMQAAQVLSMEGGGGEDSQQLCHWFVV